jgi:hypothetical protein
LKQIHLLPLSQLAEDGKDGIGFHEVRLLRDTSALSKPAKS